MLACMHGDRQKLEELSAEGIEVSSFDSAWVENQPHAQTHASTPLLTAAEGVSREKEEDTVGAVEFLLEKKADANAKNEKGWTALHFAASAGDVLVVQALLEAGATMQED